MSGSSLYCVLTCTYTLNVLYVYVLYTMYIPTFLCSIDKIENRFIVDNNWCSYEKPPNYPIFACLLPMIWNEIQEWFVLHQCKFWKEYCNGQEIGICITWITKNISYFLPYFPGGLLIVNLLNVGFTKVDYSREFWKNV